MKNLTPALQPLDHALLNALRDNHRGRNNAVKQKHLQGYLAEGNRRPTLRALRKSHERLEANLFNIGVTERGYFMEVTLADHLATKHYRVKKALAIFRSIKRGGFAWEAELQRRTQGRVSHQQEAVRMVVGRDGQLELVA